MAVTVAEGARMSTAWVKPIRIGFIGIAGTGKTSVLKQLCKSLSIPRIESFIGETLKDFNLTEESFAELSLQSRWIIQHEMFRKKIRLDRSWTCGVSDVTLLDHFLYCLWYAGSKIDNSTLASMWRAIIENCLAYDLLLFFDADDFCYTGNEFRCQTSPAEQMMQNSILKDLLAKAVVATGAKAYRLPPVPINGRYLLVKSLMKRKLQAKMSQKEIEWLARYHMD